MLVDSNPLFEWAPGIVIEEESAEDLDEENIEELEEEIQEEEAIDILADGNEEEGAYVTDVESTSEG